MNQIELEILSKPKVQEWIRERMGEWKEGDWYSYRNTSYIYIVDCTNIEDLRDRPQDYPPILRIPLAIDHRNPGRGLWGMITGTKELEEKFMGDFTLVVSTASKPFQQFFADTPYLALLKALDAQIGRE